MENSYKVCISIQILISSYLMCSSRNPEDNHVIDVCFNWSIKILHVQPYCLKSVIRSLNFMYYYILLITMLATLQTEYFNRMLEFLYE